MKLLFALLWTSVALQLGCSVGIFILKAPLSPIEALEAAIAPVALSVFPLVGAVLLWRRPQHRSGWLFAVTGLGWSITNLADAYGARATAATPWWPAVNVALWLSGGNGWLAFVSSGLLLMLILTFPDGRLPSARWRPFPWIVALATVAAVVAAAFATEPRQFAGGPADTNPFPAPPPFGEALSVLQLPIGAITLALFATTAMAMILRFRRARGVERQQLKWFTASVALVGALIAALFPLLFAFKDPRNLPPVAQAFVLYVVFSSVALIPVAAGVAILRYRLYDIDLFIKRTVVYGATSAAIAATFFIGIVALQGMLRPIISGSELAIAASTLISFALFQPIRRRVQDAVDRRFDRSRYDAARTVDAFADRLRDEVDLDALRADFLGSVQQTMAPSHASLWLRERAR